MHERQVNRRRILVGMTAAGLAAAVGGSFARAQVATPIADDSATPSADTTPGADEWSNALSRVDEEIASAQADRDAIASQTDVTVVDELLSLATALRNQASSASSGSDDILTLRLARGASAAAQAAVELIKAQMADYGLPSQQARASRILERANEVIEAFSSEVSGSTDANVTTAIQLAQRLYQTAYDRYNAGTYAEAMGTASVAAKLARIAAMLSGSLERRGRGRGRRWGERERGPKYTRTQKLPELGSEMDDWQHDLEPDEPVDVPAPSL